MAKQKIRVAVLGGGMAGLATAFELSRTPEHRAKFEVTIYQRGWRLGGKCASGRNAAFGDRIEEHGLHLWFGSYENAFALTRACYEELARAAGSPLATIEEAVEPSSDAVLFDQHDGVWSSFAMKFPPNDAVPGDGTPAPTFWTMLQRATSLHIDAWNGLDHGERGIAGPPLEGVSDETRALVAAHGIDEGPLAAGAGADVLEPARTLAEHGARENREHPNLGRAFTEIIDRFRTHVWDRWERSDRAVKLREYATSADAMLAMVRGSVVDRVYTRGLDQLNDRDLRTWLQQHGARDAALNGPLTRAWYDGAFAYLDGDVAQPEVAAGASVRALFRQQFGYKGAVVWRLQAGMGDAIVAPYYEVLRRRGVHIELFHQVQRLGLAADRGSVARVHLRRQAQLTGPTYDPLVTIKGLPCWPSEPLWNQIAGGEQLRAAGVDLEAGEDPQRATDVVLEHGRDFDVAVLAIAVGALAPICTELVEDPANERFRTMLQASRTCMTQAAQVWLNRDLSELGWPHPSTIVSTFVEPLDTYCDMTHLIDRESWTEADRTRSIAYFCGVLADHPGGTAVDAWDRAKASAIEFLEQDLGPLWPGALGGDGHFDWDLLVDRAGRSGRARFDSQFWRANFDPSERYVLTPAGSVQLRLASDESGYANLFLAGDWTRNGLDLGCVEAAMMSGRQAARAIAEETHAIAGERDWT